MSHVRHSNECKLVEISSNYYKSGSRIIVKLSELSYFKMILFIYFHSDHDEPPAGSMPYMPEATKL